MGKGRRGKREEGGAEGGRAVFMVVEEAARLVHPQRAFPDWEAAKLGGANRRTEITHTINSIYLIVY